MPSSELCGQNTPSTYTQMQENSHTNKIVKLKNKETYDLEGHRIWESE